MSGRTQFLELVHVSPNFSYSKLLRRLRPGGRLMKVRVCFRQMSGFRPEVTDVRSHSRKMYLSIRVLLLEMLDLGAPYIAARALKARSVFFPYFATVEIAFRF